MSDALLFCPFCRDCFEGVERCPDHDLPLVPFEALPPSQLDAPPDDDAPVHMLDWRRGRAELTVAALTLLAGFLVPLIEVTAAGRTQSFTGLAAAAGPAANLWSVPFAGAFFASLVLRRRTPVQMRGARLAGLMVAFAPIVSVVYSLRRVAAAAMMEGGVSVSFLAGGYVIVAASILAGVGSLRFGGPALTAGSAPSSPDSGEAPR